MTGFLLTSLVPGHFYEQDCFSNCSSCESDGKSIILCHYSCRDLQVRFAVTHYKPLDLLSSVNDSLRSLVTGSLCLLANIPYIKYQRPALANFVSRLWLLQKRHFCCCFFFFFVFVLDVAGRCHSKGFYGDVGQHKPSLGFSSVLMVLAHEFSLVEMF